MSTKFPEWDNAMPEESIAAIFQWTVENAEGQIGWYERKKVGKRMLSQILRFSSIVIASAGALCPLLDATGLLGDQNKNSFGQWGYFLLAFAAAIVGLDYYFGYSSAWMRFIIAQISLERSLKEFHYDWAILNAQQGDTAPSFAVLLQRSKDFTSQIESITKQETEAWVAEFQTNISQLEKVLKTERDARKSGSIKVIVTNSAEFEKVWIKLNGHLAKELAGVTECMIDNVTPGHHEIEAVGTQSGKTSQASKVVEVLAGAMASSEITMPAIT